MPHPEGPWSFPPPPEPRPARPRRIPRGLVVWLGVVAAAVGLYFGLCALFGPQLSGADRSQAAYLIGFLALVSSGLVFSRGLRLGVVARNLAIWTAIGAAVVLGYSYRGEIVRAFDRVRGELAPAYAVSEAPHVLTVTRSDDGGFYVMGEVNGAPVRFAVDTGADDVVLSPADARRAGIDPAKLAFDLPAQTANGVGHGAPATVRTLAVGPMRLTDLRVSVNQAPMGFSLLGMSFLKRLDSVEIRGDQMTLRWQGAPGT